MQMQLGQEITPLGNNRYFVRWHGVINSELTLDFNPLIIAHKLTGKYVLLHWQAKPKNLRTWGVYDSTTQTYRSVCSDEIPAVICEMSIVDVPETIIKTVPTAAVMLRGVSWENGRLV